MERPGRGHPSWPSPLRLPPVQSPLSIHAPSLQAVGDRPSALMSGGQRPGSWGRGKPVSSPLAPIPGPGRSVAHFVGRTLQ